MGLELFLGQICESVDALGVALSLLPVVLFDELNISKEYESAISLFFLRGVVPLILLLELLKKSGFSPRR